MTGGPRHEETERRGTLYRQACDPSKHPRICSSMSGHWDRRINMIQPVFPCRNPGKRFHMCATDVYLRQLCEQRSGWGKEREVPTSAKSCGRACVGGCGICTRASSPQWTMKERLSRMGSPEEAKVGRLLAKGRFLVI